MPATGREDTADGADRPPRAGDTAAAAAAFEHLPAPTAATEGPQHTIVAANAAYRAFARQPDLLGRPARQVLPALLGPQAADLLDLVYATGEPFTAREWPAGKDQYLDFTLTPWRDADGGVRGVLVTQADVTGQVREEPAAGAPPELQPRPWVEAAVVQEAMLPAELPVLPQVRIAARYLPAAADGAAGGDWFDAFPLPDGRIALVVGDVAGHGSSASAAMGRLRAVLRQALTDQCDLAAALVQADQFAAGDAALRTATLCAAVLDPADGRFGYVTCGHPPPLIAAPDGTARYLTGTGAGPLGAGAGPPAVPAGPVALGPGEVLLLYSDGLVLRPARTLDGGLADLAVVAGDAAANPALAGWARGTPAERVSQLTVELLTRTGYGDDVTTLALWRQPEPLAPLDLEVPARPEAAGALRRALDDWLDGLGVAFGDRQLTELSVIEVVTNAIEHAYRGARRGPVRLEAAVGADGYLRTRVSDRGRWRVPGIAETDRGEGLSVAVQFAEHLQVSHPPQGAGGPPGARGTVVTMRHRLHRQPVLAPPIVGPAAARPGGPAFAVELTASVPAARVRVSGPVDAGTADRLAARLLAACRAGVLPLTVDLSAATILAGDGVRVLYQVAAQLAAHGRDLTLVSEPGSPAAAVLDLARLPRVPR